MAQKEQSSFTFIWFSIALLVFSLFSDGAAAQSKKKSSSRSQVKPRSSDDDGPVSRRISPARETVVSKLGVARFRMDRNSPQNLADKLRTIQKGIVNILNERSYLEASLIEQDLQATSAPKRIVKSSKQHNVDAILASEVEGGFIRMSLRSGLTGRSLLRWNFPLPRSLDETRQSALLKEMVDALVGDFPYRGFIMFAKGQNVQLNIGQRQRIVPGVKLSVFEFEGENPTLNSPKNSLGEVVVTKVSSNLAIGRITRGQEKIKRYAKVDVLVNEGMSIQESEIRYSRGAWISLGPNFQFLDTQTNDSANMKMRRYKLTLSPFIEIGAGYKSLATFFSYGSASNPSNDVKFMLFNGTFEVFHADLAENVNLISSLGMHYSSYKATQKGNEAPLTSSTSYAPLIEQAVHYKVTAATRFFGFGQLLYPYFNSDEINKSSKSFTSFGLGFGGGLRIYLTPKFALESLISSRMSNWSLEGGAVQEIQYGLNIHGLYFF